MHPQPFIERSARIIVFGLLGALGAWLGARWIWPWCGPWLVEPCPLMTPLGCKVALVAGAVWGMGEAWKLDLRERSRQRHMLPRSRRPAMAIRRPE